MMKECQESRQKAWCMMLVCLCLFFAAGCRSAGKEELVSVTTAETDDTGAYGIVLTEAEARQNHIRGILAENVLVDADITSLSDYEEGVGVWDCANYWERKASAAEEEGFYFSDAEPEDTVFRDINADDFYNILNTMMESLGEEYVEMLDKAWNEEPYLGHQSYAFTDLYSPYLAIDTSEKEESAEPAFLSEDQVTSAVCQAVEQLFAEGSVFKDYGLTTKSGGYQLEFYNAVGGFPMASESIYFALPRGNVDPKTIYADIWLANGNGDEALLGGGTANDSLLHVAGYFQIYEDSFRVILYEPYEWELYSEPWEVVGINEILEKAGQELKKKNSEVVVTSVQIKMGSCVVDGSEGKKKVAYQPYWIVSYSVPDSTQYDSGYLAYDAYTGERNTVDNPAS